MQRAQPRVHCWLPGSANSGMTGTHPQGRQACQSRAAPALVTWHPEPAQDLSLHYLDPFPPDAPGEGLGAWAHAVGRSGEGSAGEKRGGKGAWEEEECPEGPSLIHPPSPGPQLARGGLHTVGTQERCSGSRTEKEGEGGSRHLRNKAACVGGAAREGCTSRCLRLLTLCSGKLLVLGTAGCQAASLASRH